MALRSRKERRAATLWELHPLFRKEKSDKPITEAELESDPAQYVEGKLGDVVFASVPPSASGHSCERLEETLRVSFADKKQVCVLTHNIELLKARKLTPKEAAAIVRRVESPSVAEEFAKREALFQQISSVTAGWTPEVTRSKAAEEVQQWAIDFLTSLQRTVGNEPPEESDDDGSDAEVQAE